MISNENTRIEIQLQRQGVSHTLRAIFLPCPHGASWHATIVGNMSKVSYPSCRICFGLSSGQTACLDIHDENIREATLKAIQNLTATPVSFAPEVEAYLCYTAHDLKLYPHIADDVYITCATYDPASDTIRHEPSGDVLIEYRGSEEPLLSVTTKYARELSMAYNEYLQPHHHRMADLDTPTYPKRWCAWLLGQYIKDLHPNERPIKVKSIERSAVSA